MSHHRQKLRGEFILHAVPVSRFCSWPFFSVCLNSYSSVKGAVHYTSQIDRGLFEGVIYDVFHSLSLSAFGQSEGRCWCKQQTVSKRWTQPPVPSPIGFVILEPQCWLPLCNFLVSKVAVFEFSSKTSKLGQQDVFVNTTGATHRQIEDCINIMILDQKNLKRQQQLHTEC